MPAAGKGLKQNIKSFSRYQSNMESVFPPKKKKKCDNCWFSLMCVTEQKEYCKGCLPGYKSWMSRN